MDAKAWIAAAGLLVTILAARADPLQDAMTALNRKDYPTAVRLISPLAREGRPAAQLLLGKLYYHGHGVKESDRDAMIWYERAARQGLPEAQYLLGNLYAYGLVEAGPDTDPARLAAQWYFEAARQGHAEAQYSLGILFLTGSGVQQDSDEARRWIDRAAAQGHTDARSYLEGAATR